MRVKKHIYSGAVCEIEIYSVSDKVRNIKAAKPKLRFNSEEERQRHKIGISKRKHARLVNENFSPSSLYSTLTFDNENEVHTYKEAKHIRDLYVRRLQYYCPNAVIFIYIGKGKSTNRIHFHMLSEGVPEEIINTQWQYGNIKDIKPLREHCYYEGEDYGQDYTGLANYLFDHWTPEQGGHRWKQTRNARQPQKECVKEVKRYYSEHKPPLAPKGYKFVECKITEFGYSYFKFVIIPPMKSKAQAAL